MRNRENAGADQKKHLRLQLLEHPGAVTLVHCPASLRKTSYQILKMICQPTELTSGADADIALTCSGKCFGGGLTTEMSKLERWTDSLQHSKVAKDHRWLAWTWQLIVRKIWSEGLGIRVQTEAEHCVIGLAPFFVEQAGTYSRIRTCRTLRSE